MSAFDFREWVEDNLDRARPSAGTEWTATCPACGKFGSFYVNVDPEKTGPFVCFSCGKSAKHFAWLMVEVEGCTYADALRQMYKHAVTFRRKETVESLLDKIKAIRLIPAELTAADWDVAPLGASAAVDHALPPEFISVWDAKRKAWQVPTYLTKRGFARETLRAWGVGYVERCWYMKQCFSNRVIIPVECPNGRAFTGRDLTGEQEPKYLNPRGADMAQMLFGWKLVRPGSDFCLVEGPLDAMKMHQHGIPTLGFGGKALSSAQLALLFAYPEDTSVTVMLDPGAEAEAYHVATQLRLRFRRTFVAKIPIGKDGGKMDPGASEKDQAHTWYEDAPLFSGARGPRTSALIADALAKSQKRFAK